MSVVIPHFEAPELLRDALSSVESQTYDHIKCIVVDDCSDCDIRSVVDEYANTRLKIHEKNQGAAATRNTGISLAEGEYIAFLDVDDTWDNRKIEAQVAIFEKNNENVGLVYSGFEQVFPDKVSITHDPVYRGNIYKKELEKDRIHPTSTVMVRNDVLEEVGGFNENLPARQDYELWLRVTEKYSVDVVDQILVTKIERKDNISNDYTRRIEGDLLVLEFVQKKINDHQISWILRRKIVSYHHYLIGRDYDLLGDRNKSLRHIIQSLLLYPLRVETWGMVLILLLGINRKGRVFRQIKRLIGQ
ncbi:glycosyltransferase family 2 protein [Halorubrum lipolyticum]|uniref:Glycosyltransferase, family 2 n=1 Tax=Halorubrum lipolyticum DSM 21995 TaxID=1227482 RepID=M0NZV6_9EURY|nr:glycosyltransferase family A protein [Halorubrum lipolyticum]EMA63078.1 Glycosyltransferase, family 2 [Halorubrum lipolyticum DSM 21995]